jgi:hypothetical protein
MMVARRAGLIVEITDGDHHGYRGSLFYELAKMGHSLLFYPAPDPRDNLVAIWGFAAGVVDPEPCLR